MEKREPMDMQWEYYPSFSSRITACNNINHIHYYSFTIIIIVLSCHLALYSSMSRLSIATILPLAKSYNQ
jgi:hypothetical protein